MAAVLIERREVEGLDFGLLVCSATAYVLSAWWIAVVGNFNITFLSVIPATALSLDYGSM